MSDTEGFRIRPANWGEDQSALRYIREVVFIAEQKVPQALEWDGEDAAAFHLLAEDGDGRSIGTGRLLASGQIGRMAVVPEWRGRGVGAALLRGLMAEARSRSMAGLFLHAQVEALEFYRRAGFSAEGEVFHEAGIAHRLMRFDALRGS